MAALRSLFTRLFASVIRSWPRLFGRSLAASSAALTPCGVCASYAVYAAALGDQLAAGRFLQLTRGSYRFGRCGTDPDQRDNECQNKGAHRVQSAFQLALRRALSLL